MVFQANEDYEKKITARCVAKPETYAERKAHREAEIAGLKQARLRACICSMIGAAWFRLGNA